jgi:hypothetical protein
MLHYDCQKALDESQIRSMAFAPCSTLHDDLCMGHGAWSFAGVLVIEFEVAICDLKLGSRIAVKSRQSTEMWN